MYYYRLLSQRLYFGGSLNLWNQRSYQRKAGLTRDVVGEQWGPNKAKRKVKLRLFVRREFNNYFLDILFSLTGSSWLSWRT